MNNDILSLLDEKFEHISPPEIYKKLWNEINLPIQMQKAAHHMLPEKEKILVLDKLSKRAYYLTEVEGKVWSCDVVNKHSKKHFEQYKKVATFVHGDSNLLAEKLEKENTKIDLFYIDGSHESGAVLKDVATLKKFQTTDQVPVWIFDDFDDRFGCYRDISLIANAAPQYYVYSPGKTASNNPTHQLVVRGYFK